jgi:hypothetical protein
MRLIYAAMMLVTCAPAQAQQATLPFDIDARHFEMSVPAGLCADGPGVDEMRKAQVALGTPNDDVFLAPCGGKLDPNTMRTWIIHARHVSSPITRDQLFDALRKKPLWAPFASPAGAPDTLVSRLRSILGPQSNITASVSPIGFDEQCAYLAGVTQTSIDATAPPINLTVVSCLTVIDGLPFTVMRMEAGTNVRKAEAALPELKRITASIRVKD